MWLEMTYSVGNEGRTSTEVGAAAAESALRGRPRVRVREAEAQRDCHESPPVKSHVASEA